MNDSLNLERMIQIQDELYKKYGEDWIAKTPENGHYSILWALGEMGEVIDIVKKKGYHQIMEDGDVRTDFIHELVDVMMYMTDVLTCFDISVEEFTKIYEAKHAYNMKRW